MKEKNKMPEDIVQTYHESEVINAKPLHGYQSAWMAHWKHTNYESTTQDHNHLSIDCEYRRGIGEDSVPEHDNVHGGSDVAVDISTSTGAIREATKAKIVTVMNETLSENPGNSQIRSLDFRLLPISERRDGALPLKGEQCALYHEEVLKSQTDASFGNNIISPGKTEIRMQSEGFLPANLLMNSSNAVEKNKLTVPASVWSDFIKSTSDTVPYAYNKGKNSMPSITCGQHELHQSSYNLASREHFSSTNYREKKISSLLKPHTSRLSRLMPSDPAHAQRDPSASCDDRLDFVSYHHWKMHYYTGTAKISSLTGPFESTKIDNFYHGSSSVLQMPSSVHDVKTMKIFTPINSGEELSRGRSKIFQTHHVPMSENNDIILSEKGQFFRESIIPTKFKQNAFSEIPYSSPPIGENARESLKLETLGSSINRERKGSVQDLETMTILKNESSAETDTMDINALQEDQLPGDFTLPSNKCSKESQNSLTCQGAITSAKERTKAEPMNTATLDINKEPLKLHSLTSPVDESETSTSKTQSLDVEHLLSHAAEQGNSKPSACGNGSLGSEPGSRWLKRLKLSTSDFALGTKSENFGETSSHEKVHMIFSKIIEGRKTSLEPKIISPAEGLKEPDLPAMNSTDGRSSFVKAKQTVEAALSHPWIQRWSHNLAASSATKHESMKLCEPKSLDPVMGGLRKKQFPSIAAMAMMGKAMGSLRPCEFMKKGPLVVWKTEKL